MQLKRMAAVVVAVAALLACSGDKKIDEDQAVAQAIRVAEGWLELVDNQNYADSWEATAEIFKKDGDIQMWRKNIENTHAQYGRCQSRTLSEALYKTRLPGAGNGQYVVIQYDSIFERKADVRETVTVKLEADGQWPVAGYILRASRTD
jgi:hypothetical protein